MPTSLDSCPRCGYALDQPSAPSLDVPPPVRSYAQAYPAPVAAPAAPSGLAMPSVPKILLGLGATCLLVAAAIFLAVAWTWLGIGGRTAVLVALTIGTALGGQLLARRDLGVAAESLTVVSLGLVLMDVLGASSAGWIGGSDRTVLVVLGVTLLVTSLSMCGTLARLFAPQVVAPLGLAAGVLGAAPEGHAEFVSLGALACFTALAMLGRGIGAVVLPWTAGTGALLSGTGFAGLAAVEASTYPTLHGLWAEGHGLGLLVLAGVLLLPWALAPGHDDLRQLACAASLSTVTVAVALPVLDESPTAITLAAAASAVLWAAVSAVVPPRWYAVPRVPLVGSLLVLVPVPAVLAAQGVADLLRVGSPFAEHWTVRLDPGTSVASPMLLPLAVGVVALAAALTVPRSGRFPFALLPVGYLTVLLTAAHFALPLLVFVVALGPLGLVVAFPSAVLTLLVLGEITVLAAYLLGRRAAGAALVLPVALGGFLWLGGHVVGAAYDHRSLTVMVVLGLLALAVPRAELAATTAGVVALASLEGVVAAGDPTVSLAVHLTVAGALVTSASLLHGRRELAWAGGLLLAAATWVRLLDLGVHAPEPYTLPAAVVLLLVGLRAMNQDPEASTVDSLLPGLALSTLPTLLWALVDPLSPRAVTVGAVFLVLVVGGASLRWTAPVLVGGLAGLVLVLRELAPYTEQTPQWLLIGTAGAVLIGTGVTWEARVRDLRQAARYVARLR